MNRKKNWGEYRYYKKSRKLHPLQTFISNNFESTEEDIGRSPCRVYYFSNEILKGETILGERSLSFPVLFSWNVDTMVGGTAAIF